MDSCNFFDVIDPEIYRSLKDMPVKSIPEVIKNELAVLLNPASRNGKDWRDLAHRLRFEDKEIKFIQSLKIKCDFLEMLEMYEKVPGNSIGKLIEELFAMRRYDAMIKFTRHRKALLAPPRPSVFVTYDYRQNHMKYILQLLDNMKNNGIVAKADEKSDSENVPEKTLKRFNEAEFVLVCISVSYNYTIVTSKMGRDVNTAALYREMREEYRRVNENTRFIPLLLPGATKHHAPEWLCNICPNEIFYTWPGQYKDIVRHIKHPEKVEEQIKKVRLLQSVPSTREFHSGDTMIKTPVDMDTPESSFLNHSGDDNKPTNTKVKVWAQDTQKKTLDYDKCTTNATAMEKATVENSNITRRPCENCNHCTTLAILGNETQAGKKVKLNQHNHSTFSENIEKNDPDKGTTFCQNDTRVGDVMEDNKDSDLLNTCRTTMLEMKELVGMVGQDLQVVGRGLATLCKQTALEGEAQNYVPIYKNSLLELYKNDLHKHLKVTCELLNHLFMAGVINKDKMTVIDCKKTDSAKIKHLLLEIDACSFTESDVLEQFIIALRSSNKNVNLSLATKLATSKLQQICINEPETQL